MRKLNTLAADFPDTYKLVKQDEVPKTYSFPKSHNHLLADDLTLQAEGGQRGAKGCRQNDVPSLLQMMIANNKTKGV